MNTLTSLDGSRVNPLEPAADPACVPNRRILVVDDNESIHRDFRKILSDETADAEFDAEEAAVFGPGPIPVRRAAFEMDFALQGEQALELVRAAAAAGERYAVAFVDMRMPPGWDGLRTTQKLWEADADLQIVICTAYSDYSWEEMIGAIGSPERLLILKKPFDAIEVLQFAHALTEKWSLLQAARSNTTALEERVSERTAELQGLNVRLESEMEERKRAEQAARVSEAEQRGLAELLELERSRLLAAQSVAKVGNWEIDLRTEGRMWSEEAYRILEIAPEPGPSRDRYVQAVHPDDIVAAEAAFTASFRSHLPSSMEHRLFMADGRIKFVEHRWIVTHDEEGRPLRATGTIQDITERKETELALTTERARLIAAQTVAKVGDWDVDLVTQTRTWSEETCRIFGVDAAQTEVTHERFLELVHPDDRAAVKAASAASLQECLPSTVKHRLVMPDGRIKFVEQRWQFVCDEQGQALRSTGTVQDITEREEAQEVLRRSERNLALAQRVSHTGSWEVLLDPAVADEKRNLHWSDEQFRIFGFEPGAVVPTDRLFHELVHPEDRERVQAAFAACLESNAPYNIEHRIRWPDGTEREVHEQAEFQRDPETGALLRIVGSSQDVTERNKAARTLREQAGMLNLAHDAIVVSGGEDRLITFWNSGAEHLYGWTAAEAIGRRIDDLIHDEHEQYLTVEHGLALSGEFRGEVHQMAKDGRKVVVSARANAVPGTDGRPGSVLIIQSDITEHRKLENQFLRAQRLESIGTLASGVAHDLNNVLAPILMSAPLLREEELTAALKHKIIDTIEASAERGAQIVKQVLTFARGIEGDRVLIDPHHLIKEMAEIAQQTFPKTIVITTRYAERLDLIEGDPTQLHQVLLNLAVNARDAMPAGGKLLIAAENLEVDENYAAMTPDAKPGPHVLIIVSDTGTGIPAHVMEKMFDPFFTTKEIGKGSGLGLSTVLGIVKSHGGTVNAYSTPQGTTFRILLPAAEGQQPATHEAELALPLGHGETILIVDDEPAICEVADVLLTKSGYKVLVADDGPAALAIFAQQHGEIAVVITDLLMPIMNGLALARIIRKMSPAARIVLSSGREDDCAPAELNAIGIAASLTKPYTQTTLLRTLHRLLHDDRGSLS